MVTKTPDAHRIKNRLQAHQKRIRTQTRRPVRVQHLSAIRFPAVLLLAVAPAHAQLIRIAPLHNHRIMCHVARHQDRQCMPSAAWSSNGRWRGTRTRRGVYCSFVVLLRRHPSLRMLGHAFLLKSSELLCTGMLLWPSHTGARRTHWEPSGQITHFLHY